MSLRFDSYAPASHCKVPNKRLQSIEHPGNVQNVENAISSLGGHKNVTSFLESKVFGRSLKLRFNSEDPLERPIPSISTKVDNLVLKITVPKWSGRKRKRGSSEPFKHSKESTGCSEEQQFQHILRSIRDNQEIYSVESVGHVETLHRFRALPDFQTPLVSNNVLKNVHENIWPLDYNGIKRFRLEFDKRGPQSGQELIPPPFFTNTSIPFNYMYTQDSSSAPHHQRPTAAQVISANSNHVPREPLRNLAEVKHQDKHVLGLIEDLERFLEKRPITTRRAALNNNVTKSKTKLQGLASYVAYEFVSGPWRKALILFGVDPRLDPKYRFFQTLAFRIRRREKRQDEVSTPRGEQKAKQSHIFDGEHVNTDDGLTWQVCDISDSLLKDIFTASPREECEPKVYGWFHNGTMAKAQVILRDKIELIRAGIRPKSEAYERISKLPDKVPPQDLVAITLENASQTETDLLEEFKFLIREGGKILGSKPSYDSSGTSLTRDGGPTTVLRVGEKGDSRSLPNINGATDDFRNREGVDYDAASSGDEDGEEVEDDDESFTQDGDDSDALDAFDDEKDSYGESDEDSGKENSGVVDD
ncbi:MAG: tau 95 subunit of transcription factor TFIIIC [Alyxoria varia]|nr:MAG: tau 95 subunit of transcription factor TFIIIC [Alyxoria varia]